MTAMPTDLVVATSTSGVGESVDVAMVAWMRRAAATGQARALREQANVTGAELAQQLRVSTSTLSLWERGLRRPNARHAEQWARLLRELG